MASNNVGSSETRATNQDCSRNSLQANGRRGINVSVCHEMVKNSPNERSGLATPAEMVIGPPLSTENASGHQRRLRGLERPAATSQTFRVSRWAQIAARW